MSHVSHDTARRQLIAALGATALASALPAAHAQSDRPVRFILPVATGSGIDNVMRNVSPTLAKVLGHPVIVENQPGAGGIVGTQQLVRAAPDGHTLSMVSNNHVIYPAVYRSVPFDPINDVTPIAVVGATPLVLVVNPKVAARNVRELVAAIKARPDSFNYGSSGNGTILHLVTEQFMDEAGVQVQHVPYKGVGPMVTDLIGGQVQIATAALPSVQQHIRTGALRAIGVGTKTRLAAAPDIPTIAEQGMPRYLVEAWLAVVGPAKLPAADVRRINQALVTTFAAPEVTSAMERQGNAIGVGTPEQAAQFMRTELVKYAALVKKAGLEPQ